MGRGPGLLLPSACCALLLVVSAGCSRSTPGEPSGPNEGRAAYQRLGCGSCHGIKREGMRAAPPLTGLRQHYDEEGLVAFLRDPKAAGESSPRLRALSERYLVNMTPVRADEATLRELARFLLDQP